MVLLAIKMNCQSCWQNSQLLMVVLLSLLVSRIAPVNASNDAKFRTACDHDTMEINCPSGEIIVIEEAVYGRTDRTTCGKSDVTDCVLPAALAITQELCFGQQSCDVDVTGDVFANPCGKGVRQGLQVVYRCTPSDKIYTMCTDFYTQSDWGYIVSGKYPEVYDTNQNCVLEVLTKLRQYGVELRLFDVEVEARTTTGCYDWLHILERDNPIIIDDYCGSIGNLKIKSPLELTRKHPVVKFRTNGMNQFRGFLIYFEVVNDPQAQGDGGDPPRNAERIKMHAEEQLLQQGDEQPAEERRAPKVKRYRNLRHQEEEADIGKIEQPDEVVQRRGLVKRPVGNQEVERVIRKSIQAVADEAPLARPRKRSAEDTGDGLKYGCTEDTLLLPRHGKLKYVKPGKSARITCQENFHLTDEDDGIMLCHKGQWVGTAGTCVAESCRELSSIANGEVIYKDTSVGSEAEYVCHLDYYMTGRTNIRRCMSDRNWSGVQPECKKAGGRSISMHTELVLAVILTAIVLTVKQRLPLIMRGVSGVLKRCMKT